ncbi:MAG TPA: N-6 DNA methylase [Lutibacter sp.]
MDNLIHNFSIKSAADFFKFKISSFSPNSENFNYILSDNDFTNFTDLKKTGEVEFNNSDELIVFTCNFQGVLSERSSKKKQFEIAKKVLKEDFKDGAIFIFYDDNGCFRFSFIRKNYGNKDQKFSSWKRYTYFVDPSKTNKTFKNRINGCNFKSLEDIQEAFSVEKLTKQFYNELFNWYQWSLSENEGFEVTYPNDISTDNDDRQIEEHIIRLITRLIFIWFIKKKKLIPDDIFNIEILDKILVDFDPNSKTNGNYYNAILQNLFFASLNKPIDERSFATGKNHQGKDEHYGIKTLFRDNNDKSWFKEDQIKIIDLFKNVPFLNGGLFECLDKENDDGKIFYYDGFSRLAGRQKRAFLPNCIFFDEQKGIIPLLERYNFTIEENSTDDIEVALDPELLGKVFENLLGAYNPETKETARKQSGSFYTPREIVDYMVNESVIQYLKKECPKVPETTWHKLFNTDEIPENLTDNDCKKITTSLRNIKILDPACGSGAFPMGVLNTLIKILKKVDTKNTLSNYDIKLELIENCIYGVDIQSIAVQISKLRFFISLVCEQETTTNAASNYGIKSLPNLETKFVAANTLIGLKQEAKSMIEWQDETLFELKNQLWDIRCHQNFRAQKWQEKKQLRKKDKELCKTIEAYLKTIATKPNFALIDDYTKQIANQEFEIDNLPVIWADVAETAIQTTIFESSKKTESIFKIDVNKERRDILKKSNKLLLKKIEQEKSKQHLANTSEALSLIEWNPYDQNTSSPFFDPEWMFGVATFDVVIGNPPYVNIEKIDGNLKKLLFEQYKTCKGRTDLYIAFIEGLLGKLNDDGILSFIIPYSFTNQNYGSLLRRLLIEKHFIVEIVDTSNYMVFESAVVKNIILSVQKSKRKNESRSRIRIVESDKNFIEKVFKEHFINQDIFLQLKENRFETKQFEHLLKLKNKLWSNSVSLEKICFIAYGARLNHKTEKIGKSNYIHREKEDLLKPFTEGECIERYVFKQYGWLNYKPLEHYNSMFTELFENEKLIFINVVKDRLRFAYDDGHFYNSHTVINCVRYDLLKNVNYVSVKRALKDADIIFSKTYNYKFLLSLLNSNLLNWYFTSFLSEGLHFYPDDAKKLPIIKLTELSQQPFITLVNQILSNKKENLDTTDLEKQIDVMVYKLYELDYEEVLIVEPEFKLSKKEYETFKS